MVLPGLAKGSGPLKGDASGVNAFQSIPSWNRLVAKKKANPVQIAAWNLHVYRLLLELSPSDHAGDLYPQSDPYAETRRLFERT